MQPSVRTSGVENRPRPLPKTPTGNTGLDKILQGGLPRGRTTLFSGGPGCGKSLLALEFAIRGAEAGEPGIYVSFEERASAVRVNAATLGWDIETLEREKKLFLLDSPVQQETIVTGNFDLKALLAIIDGLTQELGGKRLVLDAIDVLLRYYNDTFREREQLFALNDWLLDRELTSILTVKRDEGADGNSRYEFLDYLADCVIHLDQRVVDQVTTRRLRVVKYRGSDYGRNEYPYVTGLGGLRMIPVSSVEMMHKAPGGPVSSGQEHLDQVLGGGYLQGSCIMIAGASGTGKTTLACTFARGAAERGERVLYISFEESIEAIVGSLLSSGTDLRPGLKSGVIRALTAMPESMGVEEHLLRILDVTDDFQPQHMVVDAISAARRMGSDRAAFEFLVRLLNACRERGITALIVNQTTGDAVALEIAGDHISSLLDAILFLRYVESGGETNRVISVVKSRGTRHSNQIREFRITDEGVELADIYAAEGGVLTGTARQEKEARDAIDLRKIQALTEAKQREIERRRAELQAESARLSAAIAQAEIELQNMHIEREKALQSASARRNSRGDESPETTSD